MCIFVSVDMSSMTKEARTWHQILLNSLKLGLQKDINMLMRVLGSKSASSVRVTDAIVTELTS